MMNMTWKNFLDTVSQYSNLHESIYLEVKVGFYLLDRLATNDFNYLLKILNSSKFMLIKIKGFRVN